MIDHGCTGSQRITEGRVFAGLFVVFSHVKTDFEFLAKNEIRIFKSGCSKKWA